MQPLEIIPLFTNPLEKAGFPYMVTGSVAAIIYGAPRLTHEYFTEGGSEKHLTDIRNMISVQEGNLKLDWIGARVEERGLETGWRRVNGR